MQAVEVVSVGKDMPMRHPRPGSAEPVCGRRKANSSNGSTTTGAQSREECLPLIL